MSDSADSAVHWHVAGLLEEAAVKFPDNVFIAGEPGLTYAQAFRCVCGLAEVLRGHGVRRGDRVALLTRNRAELVLTAYAACSLGAVFVVLNPQVKAAGLAEIVGQCSPAATLLDESTAGLAAVPGLGAVLYCGGGEAPEGGSGLGLDKLPAVDVTGVGFPGGKDDPACLVFTSGSTGVPRGVTLSHDNIRFVVDAIQARLHYRPDDVIGNFLPMSFDYGLYQMFLAARSGAALYTGRPEVVGPRLLKVLEKEAVSILPAVPAMCTAMLMLMERHAHALPRLRAITNTGEQLPPPNIDLLTTLFPGLEVFVMYGLTECKRVSILLPEEFRGSHRDTVGRALDGTEVFAIDAAGKRLPPGETGELVIRGRHVALGYWNAPEETALRFRPCEAGGGRELHSGDLGSVDAGGYIHFSGRKDNLLKNRGFRISPLETERAACAIPGVKEAGLVKSGSDGALHLFVVADCGGVDEAEILGKLMETLEPAKVPDRVYALETMPKTLNGKLDRKALVAMTEAGAR